MIWSDGDKALGLKHIRTGPYTPRINGMAERLIQTLSKDWSYAVAFQTQKYVTGGYLATCRSITSSGSTQLSATDHINSG